MVWKNTAHRWGSVHKWLHWIIAALIIGTSLIILHINGSTWWFESGDLIFIEYIHWHKTFGLMALALIIARIWWRRRNPVPVTADLTAFEKTWSHRTHLALYAVMIALPLTGWISSSLFGSSTNVFGLFTIPPITPKYEPPLAFFYWTHFVLAWTMIALVTLHVGAALYHGFVRKDGVLRAMLPGGRAIDDGGARHG